MTKVRLRDGSGELSLKYLYEDVDRHGNHRLYFRKRGQRKIRLRETPGTDAFYKEYRAALEGRIQPPKSKTSDGLTPGTLRWLVAEYFRSPEFKNLKAGHVRRRLLESICAERFKDLNDDIPHGDKPFAPMQARHVRRIRDAHADTPEGANNRVKALRRLFAWAVETDLATTNPTRDVPRLRAPNRMTGFHTWTIKEIRQYEARHPIGSKARLAMALLIFTGTRRSDAVRLGPQMETSGWLRFTEIKGSNRNPKNREIPILPELRAVIDATPSGHLSYLITAYGKPFTAAGFGNWFRKQCDAASLPQCSAHGLRKAGATIAAEQGATEHQLMAIFGWETLQQVEGYTRRANRKKLAAQAMHLIVPEAETLPASGSKKERL